MPNLKNFCEKDTKLTIDPYKQSKELKLCPLSDRHPISSGYGLSLKEK